MNMPDKDEIIQKLINLLSELTSEIDNRGLVDALDGLYWYDAVDYLVELGEFSSYPKGKISKNEYASSS